MRDQYYGQFALFIFFIVVIGLLTPYLPGLSWIHEYGHYIYAKSYGFKAYIKDAHTTVILASGHPPKNFFLAGNCFSLFVYFSIGLFVIAVCSYKNFFLAGLFCGLFIGEMSSVIISGIRLNTDFDKIKAFYGVDPYQAYGFYAYLFLIILLVMAIRKTLAIRKEVEQSENVANNNYSKLNCDSRR